MSPRSRGAAARDGARRGRARSPTPPATTGATPGLAHLLAVSGQNVMLLAALALPVLMLAGAGPRARLAALAVLIARLRAARGSGPVAPARRASWGSAGSPRWRPPGRRRAGTRCCSPRPRRSPGTRAPGPTPAGSSRSRRSPGSSPGRAARARLGAAVASCAGWAARLAGALADGVAITVAATLATAPLLAHHFGYVPLAGLPANLARPAGGGAGDVARHGQDRARPALGSARSRPDRRRRSAAAAHRHGCLDPRRLPRRRSPSASPTCPAARLALPLRLRRRRRGRLRRRSAWPRSPLRRRTHVASATGLRSGPARWRWLPASRAPPRSRRSLMRRRARRRRGAARRGPGRPTGSPSASSTSARATPTLIQHPDGTAVLFDGGPPEARRRSPPAPGRRAAARPGRGHPPLARPPRRPRGGAAPLPRRRCSSTAATAPRDPPSARSSGWPTERGVRRVPALAPLTLTLAGGDLRIRVLVAAAAAARARRPRTPTRARVVAIVSSGGFDLMLSADAESEAAAAARPARRGRHEGAPPRQLRPGPARGARAAATRGRRRSRWACTTPTATRRPSTLAALAGRARRRPTAPTATARSRSRAEHGELRLETER